MKYDERENKMIVNCACLPVARTKMWEKKNENKIKIKETFEMIQY